MIKVLGIKGKKSKIRGICRSLQEYNKSKERKKELKIHLKDFMRENTINTDVLDVVKGVSRTTRQFLSEYYNLKGKKVHKIVDKLSLLFYQRKDEMNQRAKELFPKIFI